MEFLIGVLLCLTISFIFLWYDAQSEVKRLRSRNVELKLQRDYYHGKAFEFLKALQQKPVAIADSKIPWKTVFGWPKNTIVTKEMVDRKYKRLAMAHHPDQGGSEYGMKLLNLAKEKAYEEVK